MAAALLATATRLCPLVKTFTSSFRGIAGFIGDEPGICRCFAEQIPDLTHSVVSSGMTNVFSEATLCSHGTSFSAVALDQKRSDWPPSTVMIWPVIHPAKGEA